MTISEQETDRKKTPANYRQWISPYFDSWTLIDKVGERREAILGRTLSETMYAMLLVDWGMSQEISKEQKPFIPSTKEVGYKLADAGHHIRRLQSYYRGDLAVTLDYAERELIRIRQEVMGILEQADSSDVNAKRLLETAKPEIAEARQGKRSRSISDSHGPER